jgi:DNA-binding HxlR family transcriptional regulator
LWGKAGCSFPTPHADHRTQSGQGGPSKVPQKDSPKTGRAGVLTPLIHGRARLLILSHLIKSGATPFTELRVLLSMTDGTLSVHLTRLEDGGVVGIEKTFVGKKPCTVIKVTRSGRTKFKKYVKELQAIIPGLEN